MSKSEKFWDKTATRYADRVKEDDEEAIIVLDLIRKYLQSSDIVLDVGCATGIYAFEIAPQVEEVWGIDISSEMIQAAKRNAKKRDVTNVQFMQAEIFDPRLKDGFFNVVLALNILHLVEDPSQVVEKIKKLLEPGGMFVSVTPCLGANRSPVVYLIRLMSLLGVVPKTFTFKPNEVEALVAGAGFDILDTQIIKDSTSNIILAARRKTS